MPVAGYTLTEEAVADVTDVVRSHRRKNQNTPPRRGTIRGLSRQGLIEVLLTADLPESGSATGYLLRNGSSTSIEVDVVGDCDLCSTLTDPLLAPRSGCRVICGWLGGLWRALRRSGGCCTQSSSSSSSSPSSSSLSSSSSPSSSSPSSSLSSSESSVSSSQPSSDPSSIPSSETECVEVVKDVTFSATSCTITKTMVNVRKC